MEGSRRNLPLSKDMGIEADEIEGKSQDGEEAEVKNKDGGEDVWQYSNACNVPN